MLVNVVFVDSKGAYEVYAEQVDLDYWNIRQWRRLYLHLCQRQKDEFTKLLFIPYNTDPF